jgi:hypothetical protein
MGGDLTLESTQAGGSTFTVTLRRARKAERDGAVARAARDGDDRAVTR